MAAIENDDYRKLPMVLFTVGIVGLVILFLSKLIATAFDQPKVIELIGFATAMLMMVSISLYRLRTYARKRSTSTRHIIKEVKIRLVQSRQPKSVRVFAAGLGGVIGTVFGGMFYLNGGRYYSLIGVTAFTIAGALALSLLVGADHPRIKNKQQ